MERKPKISIIVPVYNVEDYMALSLDSLRAQTLEDIEIICIDDGSTDGSGALLDMYAALDPRFQVLHQANGGVSAARNLGIERAQGEYICFFDPDDLLIPNACETIISAFEKTGADIVTYGGLPYPEMYGYPWLNDVLSPRDIVYTNFDPAILTREKTRPFVWKTACKRDFLIETNVRFDVSLALGEDQVFLFAIFPRSTTSAVISDKLIRYRVKREGSVMFDRATDRSTRIREHIQIVDSILTDWQSAGFLDAWKQEIFDWNIEFLIHDIFAGYDENEQPEMSAALAAVWRHHFSDEFLSSRERVRRYGSYVRLILDGAPRPSRQEQKLMLFRYYVAEYGIKHAIRTSLSSVRDRVAPHKTPAIASSQEENWHAEDNRRRALAKEKLLAAYRKIDAS